MAFYISGANIFTVIRIYNFENFIFTNCRIALTAEPFRLDTKYIKNRAITCYYTSILRLTSRLLLGLSAKTRKSVFVLFYNKYDDYSPYFRPGDFKSPAQEISIDGNNLSPEELLDLGRGKYKIRVSDIRKGLTFRKPSFFYFRP